MQFYDTIAEVQAAYLTKATADKKSCPKQAVILGGKIIASSTGDRPFKHAANCPIEVTAKVMNKYIHSGKVDDEAPILVTSDTQGFLDDRKKIFSFVTPALGENSLKPISITSGGLMSRYSICVFPAKHNFAIESEAVTVDMYRSTIDGQLYEEANLPEQNQDRCLQKYSQMVKGERNARISDTDKYAELSDVTVQSTEGAKRAQLTDDEKAEVLAYRQALRDLPEAEGFPFVDFPVIPECIKYEAEKKIANREAMENMY